MPEFEDRAKWEARIKRDLLELTEPQVQTLLRYLGDPPDASRVPASFWASLGEDITASLEPSLEQIYVESAQQTVGSVPRVLRVDWHLANEPAAAWADEWAGFLVKGITATSQDRLQNYVAGFFRNQGTTVGDLRTQLETLFGPARAELIATTEVTRAAAQGDIGIIGQIQEANPRIQMLPFWDTSMDEWVCPVCGPKGLQGVQGVMVNGEPRFKSRDGSTYGAPPDPHPRCRCGMRWEPAPRRGGAARPAAPVPAPLPEPPPIPEPEPTPTPVEPITSPGESMPETAGSASHAKPAGKPVSDAVKLPKSKAGKLYRKVLDIIDNIHGDGELTPIPVKTKKLGRGTMGMFTRTRENIPIEVAVAPRADHPETTLAHELGHYLDNHLGRQKNGAFASEMAAYNLESPLMEWWHTVQESQAYKDLIDVRDHPERHRQEVVYYTQDGRPIRAISEPDGRFMEYLTRPREIWARSYAQYISLRSGNVDMQVQISAQRNDDAIYSQKQWTPEDFGPIAEAMDRLLQAIGWTE